MAKKVIKITETRLRGIVANVIEEVFRRGDFRINESTDASDYICIGEIPYNPFYYGEPKFYIMISPQPIRRFGEEGYDILYTENNDGSGRQTTSIPAYIKEQATIYEEHLDDEYGEAFLGKKKDGEAIEKQHEEFVSRLFLLGDDVVLHHNSSYKITDGIIKNGKMNHYSNNSDLGIYFWGSRNSGSDPSGGGRYTYYCLIPRKELYDFETNRERLSLYQAMKKYRYVGQYWKNDGSAIVVTTFKFTPIYCILDKMSGEWFDENWEKIKKPF